MNIPALALSATVACSAFPAMAQYAPYAPPPYGETAVPARIFSQQELDRMLAPIALYPDALLSQILMAATYPVEIAEAARWLRSNPGLAGAEAVNLAAQSYWDPSVQSLCAFPQLVFMMAAQMAWTEDLGEAFLAQQPYVMDTVQALRQRAWAAGTLRSSSEILVRSDGPMIVIEPAQPQFVYLPYYDPLIVYGTWWYPAAPVRWRPWPGYAARPGAHFYWGPAVTVSSGFLFGHFDWGRRNVIVVHERFAPAPRPWVFAPEHRLGHPYRHEVLRQRFVAQPHVERQEGPRDRGREPRRFEPRPEQRGREPRSQLQPAQPQLQAEQRQQQAQPQRQVRPEPAAQPQQGIMRYSTPAQIQAPPQPAQTQASPQPPAQPQQGIMRYSTPAQIQAPPQPARTQASPQPPAQPQQGIMRYSTPAQTQVPQPRPEPARQAARVEERRERAVEQPKAQPAAPQALMRAGEPRGEMREQGRGGEQRGGR